LSGNSTRLQAIYNVEAYVPPAVSFSHEEEVGEVFGSNVFTRAEMQARLPKAVFKSLVATIEKGIKLDLAVADAVALAMKDWAVEKGATHYAHVFYPQTGLTAEKHDSFLDPVGDGTTFASFAGKTLIQGEPVGRSAQHFRGARLHRLGRHQPGLHPGEPERQHTVHPDGLRFDDR